MNLSNIPHRVIRYSFYAIFFFVPLIFWKDTSELYELNKMWITFGLTILIAACWAIKTIVLRKFYFQRTPLDIPIGLFVASQIISTVFSLDSYVSFWGYYSRFNGGLASTLCYVFLYYALLSNFDLKTELVGVVKKILTISLISGAIVALWGLPSHFGYDPTCLIFRGSLDVSCWTADFQPKIRIFSTLGQPAWLGAYLAILTPLLFAFFLKSERKLYAIVFALLAILFYVDLLFTRSRAALLGFWISTLFFAAHYVFFELKIKFKELTPGKIWEKTKSFYLLVIVLLAISAFVLNPIELGGKAETKKSAQPPTGSFSTGGGGTESGKIRLFVWQGALNAWLHNPIIGTGVETFAFAYYKYKAVGHNLTSEWNYLYNKAHNEYLNYLTTSGILGLGTYLFLIFTFFRSIWKFVNRKTDLLVLGLVAGYTSILVTNFFGFSVVIVNLYFFLIPAIIFVLLQKLSPQKAFVRSFGKKTGHMGLSLLQKVDIAAVLLATTFFLLFLVNFWLADQAYSTGSNLVRAGDYSSSYSSLKVAISRVGFEPTYKDELASNDAIFSVALLSNLPQEEKDQKTTLSFAEELAKEAIDLAEEITKEHPNNVVFWKTKVRVYYSLSQIDPSYTKDALNAIKKAQALAPKDANISYNLGLLYGQDGDTKKAIETLNETVKLKPNWDRPHYALGLFYRQLATDKNGRVIDFELNQKAINEMKFILEKIDPNNQEAKDALEAFEK